MFHFVFRRKNIMTKMGCQRMQGQDVYGSTIHASYGPVGHQKQHQGYHYHEKGNSYNTNVNRNNVSPTRTRPHSQTYRKLQSADQQKTINFPASNQQTSDNPAFNQHMSIYPSSNQQTSNYPTLNQQTPNCMDEHLQTPNISSQFIEDHPGELNLLDTLLNGGTNCVATEEDPNNGLQSLVKKFTQENKSSRQLLMLQQQLYQEEQTPIGGSSSTQFYTHYSRYQQPPAGGYYDNSQSQWQQTAYPTQNGYYDNYTNNCQSQTQVPPYRGFQPIRSASPSESSQCSSMSPCDFNSEEYPGAVDLLISNLDYNISPREWKHILTTNFHSHIKILFIDVFLQPDNTSLGVVKVGSIDEARFAISQFHRKKIGYKRIHVTLRTDETTNTASTIRSEAIALLSEAKDNVLPLFKFIELFSKRFNRSVSVSELYKMKDTIEINEKGGAGRMIHLAPGLKKASPTEKTSENSEVQEITEHVVCKYHCPEGSFMYAEAINTCILPSVKVQLKTFAPQVHSLLMTHDGDIPLMSFPACFSAEVAQLVYVYEGGVALEHVLSCVPGVQISVSNTGFKKVIWAENRPPGSPDPGSPSSGSLNQLLAQFGREMVDLLKAMPNCRLAFSKFIPIYHQHFGRQCRVADYGYSRLNELFDAVPHVVQVMGTGDRKVLTLTHKAQTKRFTADLLRLLKNVPGRQVCLSSLTEEFCKMFNRSWDIIEYGMCHLDDMLSDIPPNTVVMTQDGHNTLISLPRVEPTDEELERIKQFSLEIVDLLKHSDHCKMLFSKLIPAYHHHFGRQCRVSDYGYSKLLDLLEALPQVIELDDEGEEKIIKLTESKLRKVVGDQIISLLKHRKVQCYPLDQLMPAYTQFYGYAIPLGDLRVHNPQQLMSKLKHVVKLEVYDGREYIVVADRTSAPPLARQVLQLLMDQSGGSLPLMELSSRYKTTFGTEPNITKIKEELLDYVQISGDDESGVISLTPLQTLARDLRILLHAHGKIMLAQLEKLFYEHFCVEIKPALYGFPTIVALLMAIPHVVAMKGKGNRKVVHLSGDLQGSLPIIDESYSSRPDSDTPSNDSGSALTDEDTTTEQKFRPQDILDEHVPSGMPSPALRPDSFGAHIDLIKFDSNPDYRDTIFASICEEEKSQQQTPLCQTPTSQLLQLAAQFLPTADDIGGSGKAPEGARAPKSTLDLLKEGWWAASPSQLQEVSKSIKNAGIADNMAALSLLENVHKGETTGKEKISRRNEDEEEVKNEELYLQNKQDNKRKKPVTEKMDKDGTQHQYAIHSLASTLTYLRESQQICDASGDNMDKTKGVKLLRRTDTDSTILREQRESPTREQRESPTEQNYLTIKDNERQSPLPDNSVSHSLQPGSYWYSKQFQSKSSNIELPSKSPDDVRKVLASLAQSKPKSSEHGETDTSNDIETTTPQASIDNSESFSADTITDDFSDIDSKKWSQIGDGLKAKYADEYDSGGADIKGNWEVLKMEYPGNPKGNTERIIPGKTTKHDIEHKLGNCIAEDCMCYEAVFRQDQPIETSSVKSDSSFAESLDLSPMKKKCQTSRLSASSLSDESGNSSINKRRSRIAAKFGQTVE
ncbi:meiosis regulator and mRNA stability factor 1-like isoform X2 [Dreissena polymorpha]|uniref:meiosis regulator and mRNA stability factor 1-like isoform X2 n=1 Tax=Dreissena polymorpha TaxID=45954 RepID=UPI0022642EC1|nr:meiosis regulator and mRNA stability factor 1-like isoform X2 [Dreissena polymorpha]